MSTRAIALASFSLATVLLTAACGSAGPNTSAPAGAGASSAPQATTAAASDTFPVTVEHAFGSTTIEKKPERVASIAWGNHEVPLALGVVPVGMSKAVWGDDDKDGVLPWVEDKITELGGQTPVLFDDTDSIDYEAVANTQPDIILAAYSGLTKEQYDKLSQIAPVVAYPENAWATSMDDMIELNSKALGRSADGEKLVDSLDAQVDAAAAKHPSLKGKSAMFAYVDEADLSKVGFYNTLDPRAELLEEVGMKTPKVVSEAEKSKTFFSTISAEKSDDLADVDMMVSYSKDGAATLKTIQADPLWSKMTPVKNGAIAFLQDDTPLAAVGNPTPLNIPWGLDRYLGELDKAAAKAK